MLPFRGRAKSVARAEARLPTVRAVDSWPSGYPASASISSNDMAEIVDAVDAQGASMIPVDG